MLLVYPLQIYDIFTNFVNKEILSGKYDSLPESAFMYCGTIEDVVEKAKKMESQE